MLSFSPLILSLSHIPTKKIHALKQKWSKESLRIQKKEKKKIRRVVHMSKSIKNDADIMLLISQHFQ